MAGKVQAHHKKLCKKHYGVASKFFHKQIMAKLYAKPFLNTWDVG